MSGNSVFNATVCIFGILILAIHVVNVFMKKEKRRDELYLLNFFIFTIIHFITYLTFTLIKVSYTSNDIIIGFYTLFYIMNNIELFLLFRYMQIYVVLKPKINKILSIR